jgi:lysophospholipase L1-like esterase
MNPALIDYYYRRGGGGSAPFLVTSKQGTYSDPVDGGSSLGGTITWILPETRPFEQTLTEFKVYCSGAGTIKLKMFQPNNGGFAVTDLQTLTCVIGLNTFTVVGTTLNTATIPANSMIGFKPVTATVRYTADGTAYGMGYCYVVGDASGSNVTLITTTYKNEIQAQYSTEFMSDVAVEQYFLSDDCSGNVLPSWGLTNGTPWTFSGGNCLNGGISLTNFLDFYPTTNMNDNFFKVQFQFTAAGNRFCIYKKPIINDAGGTTGTIVEADLNNNKLVFYNSWTGGTTYTLPSAQSELVLSNLTLVTGRVYEFELRKDRKLTIATITDTTNSDTESLTVDNDPTKLAGLSYGRFGMTALAGAAGDIKVSDIKAGNINYSPDILIVGDSITEGSGASVQNTDGFANLFVINKNAVASGDGGTKLLNILKRLRFELKCGNYRYVIVESVNNCQSAGDVTDYANQIPEVYQEIVNSGATPIFCMPTPNSDATQNARLDTNRAFLLGTGYNVARTDIALSVGGDGSTYDASLMNDGVHPNTAGHLLMYNRILSDFPELV